MFVKREIWGIGSESCLTITEIPGQMVECSDVHSKLEHVSELCGHTSRVWGVDWHPSLPLFASCGEDGITMVWQLNQSTGDWRNIACLKDPQGGTMRSCAFSKDGNCIATASFGGITAVWCCSRDGEEMEYDRPYWECVATLEGHEKEVKSVSWSHSGSLIATCGRDKTVWIWEVFEDNEFECLGILQEHDQDVKSVVWHPVFELLVSTSYDNMIRIWEERAADWQCRETLRGHENTVWMADFDSSGTRLVSVDHNGVIKLWCSTDPSGAPYGFECVYSTNVPHSESIFTVSWSRLNGKIATGSADNSIAIIEKGTRPDGTGECLKTLLVEKEPHGEFEVNCVKWSPHDNNKCGNFIVSGGDDCKVNIWKLT